MDRIFATGQRHRESSDASWTQQAVRLLLRLIKPALGIPHKASEKLHFHSTTGRRYGPLNGPLTRDILPSDEVEITDWRTKETLNT
jgi:hypothetical protein